MKLDYLKVLKEKKELVSVVLLGVSAFFAVLILVKVTGFFTASARAESLVKKAIAQNETDANDMDKYFAKYKVLAEALKKNNLFVPSAQKQHPIKEVWGIFGDEVLIKDKWYKVGAGVGDAKIVAIGPTEVTIEWDGNKKTFAPIDAAGPSQPGGPRDSRAVAKAGEPGGGSAQMVAVGSASAVRPMGGRGGMEGPMAGMMGRFQNMSEADRDRFRAQMQERRDRYMNMSEAERERFRAEMRERFGGGRPQGGGRPPGGGRSSGGGRDSGGGRRGGR